MPQQINKKIAVVLAAGKGRRMQSESAKVLAKVANQPLLFHVIENVKAAGFSLIVVIVGYAKEQVEDYLQNFYGNDFFPRPKEISSLIEIEKFSVCTALQQETKGTADALLASEALLQKHKCEVLVTCGDMPLISTENFRDFYDFHHRENAALSIMSANLPDPTGYGRVIRQAAGGQFEKISEEKDALPEERKIKEINTGTYMLHCPQFFGALRQIGKKNEQGEYYLTDLAQLYVQQKKTVAVFLLSNYLQAQGINTLADQKRAEQILANGCN